MKKWQLWLIAAALLMISGKAAASKLSKATTRYDEAFKRAGAKYGVDWLLLKAIARQESSLNHEAVHAASNSYGLVQILCVPDKNGACTNKFNLPNWAGATTKKLLDDIDYNVSIGAQVFAWNLKTYGSIEKALAVYNSWDQRNQPKQGPFKNQYYVDRIMGFYKQLKAGDL